MGFFKNLFGQGYSTKPDPHVLAGYTLVRSDFLAVWAWAWT
jgi:hypothetical protein